MAPAGGGGAGGGGGSGGGGGGNIKVVVRVRPFNGRELDRHAKCIVQMKDAQTILVPPPDAEERLRASAAKGGSGNKVFAFDKSYWSFNHHDPHFAGQDNLFEDLGRPLLDNAFQGYNNCIFAYGQTGSGKSYSMMGYGAEAGVIPRICQDMFERITELQRDANLGCTVEVSYLEIYNERVRDLLNPATKGNLKVREHPSTGPYVEDLAKLVVRSFAEIENLMDEGNKARTVAATNMNETSSRSHAVFTLTLTQKRHDVETSMDTEKVAKISLVDLAGSERATSTGATGARLKEGAEINRSLSTLGRVIAALADLSSGKKKNASMVPYRDSVLTWLLKDSLGGNSMTAMIAAISPADINFEETLSTLRYADSAKRIKNHAVVNEDPNARMIRELKEELAQLRSKLSGAPGSGMPHEVYEDGTPLEKQFVSITSADGSVKQVSKAEIAEQLSQSEKLYTDLNQTWEQKLQKTEQIHKEREAALEELGISIEKGFVGLHTPKKMPHLVNLSDDPLLAECLVYNLKPGPTTVGNVEAVGTSSEIRLNGSRILPEHCTFENVDGVVTVLPNEGADVMVNGLRIEEPKRLRSGYRIILGDFHIFRFNHPQEARAERAEQSLLRHSITASQLGSPIPSRQTNGHERSDSRAFSDFGDLTGSSRPDSPAPGFLLTQQQLRNGRDSDWSLARREAASALLGPDQKMAQLTDDELDNLFEDVQRVRAGRRGRSESRLDMLEDDMESVTSSFPVVREKYASTGTIDNFSLDTALTMPSTPQQQHGDGGVDEKLRLVREDMQRQLDRQKDEYQEKLREAAETENVQVEEIRVEKERMEESLRQVKEEMQAQLRTQKEEFEAQLREIKKNEDEDDDDRRRQSRELSGREKEVAKAVVEHWRQRRYVRMAEAVLQHASMLKEAQIMGQEMGKSVSFQFAIVDTGHTLPSSYDLVLNGISGEDDDEALDAAPKPCVGVRVLDLKHNVLHLWSLSKLQKRVHLMRQIHQYLDRPDYLQHLNKSNPFSEPHPPTYSLIGDAAVSLSAVFERRVQDVTLDVVSPHTCSVIGIIKLSLEPSLAEAPSSTLKFNVVMHDMCGFAEREGTDVHAQLFIPRSTSGLSAEDEDENAGVTTTQMIRAFDEGPIRFESVHSMSLPLSSSPHTSSLRIAVFARVSRMHLDKLLSWDGMRDSLSPPTTTTTSTASAQRKKNNKPTGPRIPEHAFHASSTHDVFCRAQILELDESGRYTPVPVTQSSELDPGTYQLRHGVQRRIVVNLSHDSGADLTWRDITNLRVAGDVTLIDPQGRPVPSSSSSSSPPETDATATTADIPLKPVGQPALHTSPAGIHSATLLGQWDSSLHDSVLLDRVTAERYKISLTLRWDALASSSRLPDPLVFSLELACRIQPRSQRNRSASPALAGFIGQLWGSVATPVVRTVHSTTGIFGIDLRPASVKRVGDLWRMDTSGEYVKGEEGLVGSGWAPRGVSLVRDFVEMRARERRSREVEDAKGRLSRGALARRAKLPATATTTTTTINGTGEREEKRLQDLLRKYVDLWTSRRETAEPGALILARQGSDSPPSSSSDPQPSSSPLPPPRLIATVTPQRKNPSLLKAGYVLMPSDSDPDKEPRWVRRFVELRPPYLHIYSVPGGGEAGGGGEELRAINLVNSRVDRSPEIVRLLGDGRAPRREVVFAIYAMRNTHIFATRGEREKGEWILAVDRAYFDGEEGEGGGVHR